MSGKCSSMDEIKTMVSTVMTGRPKIIVGDVRFWTGENTIYIEDVSGKYAYVTPNTDQNDTVHLSNNLRDRIMSQMLSMAILSAELVSGENAKVE